MAHLVFIPTPGQGHLYSAVELAKLLVERERRLSVSILIMTLPAGTKPQSLAATKSQDRISYIDLSHNDYEPDPAKAAAVNFGGFVDYHRPQVTAILTELTRSTRLAGVVVDMFCVNMIDVAEEVGVASYVYLTSGAGFLGLTFHALDHDLTQFKDSDAELVVPGFVNSVPAKVLPAGLTDVTWSKMFLSLAVKFKDAKGILVNTFFELQSHAVECLLQNDTVPPIYPVGPLLNLEGESDNSSSSETQAIVTWLDNQLPSSVVFLCFGSKGCFDVDQVVEIARALENSGTRFLWSLRRAGPKGKLGFAENYENVTEILPEGFLERTAETGKVIGWAPQVAVLSHPAVGGFVSHCGWNSALESIWFGVPVATWPISAEQQINAFELVKESGLAVEIKLDYRKDFGGEANYLITAEEIENGIKQLVEVIENDESLIKQKVKDMSKKSRMAVAKGGSSYGYLDRFIEVVMCDKNSVTGN